MCSVTVGAREAREADWVEENVQFERRSTQYYKTREGIIKLTKKVAQRNRRFVLTIAVKTTIWPLVLWYVWFTTKDILMW